jgi:hypothetical protein
MDHDTAADLRYQEADVGLIETKGSREHAGFVPAHRIGRVEGVARDLADIDGGAASIPQEQDGSLLGSSITFADVGLKRTGGGRGVR